MSTANTQAAPMQYVIPQDALLAMMNQLTQNQQHQSTIEHKAPPRKRPAKRPANELSWSYPI